MSQTVEVTVPLPVDLVKMPFPKVLDDRLQFLLDEQDRKGKLTTAERKEAEGLAQVATVLSLLKSSAQLKTRKR